LRIKTSSVLRYIDRLKASIERRNILFQRGFYLIATFSSSRRAYSLPLFLFVIPLALHFAALQFALVFMLGMSFLELSFYRFANAVLRIFSLSG